MERAPLEKPLNELWKELPGNLQQAGATRYIEIADVRLTSSLRRIQWMADAMGDSLRASLARPGVALLMFFAPGVGLLMFLPQALNKLPLPT